METLNIRNDGAVRIVEMNRPDALNAFNAVLIDDLAQAFQDATADDSVKVVVLTGAGRAFSAGADLKQMAGGRDPDYEVRYGWSTLIEILIDFPKPFIVAVNGIGVGVGATICGIADLTYMSSEARLRCPFSALGLTAEAGSTVTFPQLVGYQQAFWMLVASEWTSAEECVAAGLALEVLAPDQLMTRTLEQAHKLAALPLVSLMKTKSLMRDPVRARLKEAIRAENQGLADLRGKPANVEALSAFKEKREPDFTGL